jgi:hypothetical protein
MPPSRPTGQELQQIGGIEANNTLKGSGGVLSPGGWGGKGVQLGVDAAVGMIPGVGWVNTAMGIFGGLPEGKGFFAGPTIGGGMRSLLENGYPQNSPIGPRNVDGSGGFEENRFGAPALQTPMDPNSTNANAVSGITNPNPIAFDHRQFYGNPAHPEWG